MFDIFMADERGPVTRLQNKNMKTQNGFCITHEYSGTTPSIVSTHRTLSGAQARYSRRLASFRTAYPSTFPTRAIFPLALRALINGNAGDTVSA
jgi:hypothetical protein